MPKKGEATSLPRGDASALSFVAVALRPATMRPANPQGATKPVLKKVGGALALARKKVFVAADE